MISDFTIFNWCCRFDYLVSWNWTDLETNAWFELRWDCLLLLFFFLTLTEWLIFNHITVTQTLVVCTWFNVICTRAYDLLYGPVMAKEEEWNLAWVLERTFCVCLPKISNLMQRWIWLPKIWITEHNRNPEQKKEQKKIAKGLQHAEVSKYSKSKSGNWVFATNI